MSKIDETVQISNKNKRVADVNVNDYSPQVTKEEVELHVHKQ